MPLDLLSNLKLLVFSAFDEQKINQKQSDTHADTDVCHIEHRKIDQTEIKEIYYIIQPDPVNHISHCTGCDQHRTDSQHTIG